MSKALDELANRDDDLVNAVERNAAALEKALEGGVLYVKDANQV